MAVHTELIGSPNYIVIGPGPAARGTSEKAAAWLCKHSGVCR